MAPEPPEPIGFIPAAAQLKLCTGGAGAAPGFGASQTVHLSTAVAGFDNIHVEQVQLLPVFVLVGFAPAADQSKGFAGGALAPGFGASQTVHFSVAVAGFDSMQVEHVQLSPAPGELAGFIPAAAKSKPLTGAGVRGLPTWTGFGAGAEKSKGGREDMASALASSRALAYRV